MSSDSPLQHQAFRYSLIGIHWFYARGNGRRTWRIIRRFGLFKNLPGYLWIASLSSLIAHLFSILWNKARESKMLPRVSLPSHKETLHHLRPKIEHKLHCFYFFPTHFLNHMSKLFCPSTGCNVWKKLDLQSSDCNRLPTLQSLLSLGHLRS